MDRPASAANVRRSNRWRSQRRTRVTWACTVPARCAGRDPGRRRCRAIQPVTAFNTEADTSRLARWDTAGSRGSGDRPLARRSSPREPAPSYWTSAVTSDDTNQAVKAGEKTSMTLTIGTETATYGLYQLHV